MAIPSGMLAPNGNRQTVVLPAIQATTRPAGSLLKASPGYDSIRPGKNRFQGKGPSGGFREMEYAEDVGGTGAALAIVPGETSQLAASEWVSSDDPYASAGAMVVSDRGRAQEPSFAMRLHEAYSVLPDMGDRHPGRPRTLATWLVNPISMFRRDYREHPAITLLATGGLVYILNILARDIESGYRRRSSGGGVATDVSAAPASAVAGTGNVAADTIDEIGKTGDRVIREIEKTGESVVSTIRDTAKDVT